MSVGRGGDGDGVTVAFLADHVTRLEVYYVSTTTVYYNYLLYNFHLPYLCCTSACLMSCSDLLGITYLYVHDIAHQSLCPIPHGRASFEDSNNSPFTCNFTQRLKRNNYAVLKKPLSSACVSQFSGGMCPGFQGEPPVALPTPNTKCNFSTN